MAQTTANDVLGRDLGVIYRVTDGRHEDVDLRTRRRAIRRDHFRDVEVEAGIGNAIQAVVHRIKTVKGELADLGHPEYGSRHHELIGRPNSENNRNLVKLYVLQALSEEPRIERIHRAAIEFDRRRGPDTVTIVLDLTFIGSQVEANLVVPFDFGGRS